METVAAVGLYLHPGLIARVLPLLQHTLLLLLLLPHPRQYLAANSGYTEVMALMISGLQCHDLLRQDPPRV